MNNQSNNIQAGQITFAENNSDGSLQRLLVNEVDFATVAPLVMVRCQLMSSVADVCFFCISSVAIT